jgi:cytochrome c peroxidase
MKFVVALCCLLLFAAHAIALDVDAKLDIVQRVYELEPKDCRPPVASPQEVAAGRVMFETKSLAGHRDTSCSTCHLDRFGSADGLPIAVGVAGEGEGQERYVHGAGILVQRNALSMIGRGGRIFPVLFWDGRVQEQNGKIVSQFGEHISPVFRTPLAVAASLPFLERDEFLGRTNAIGGNDIQTAVGDKLYQRRYLAVSRAIRQRLISPENDEDARVAQALRSTGVDLEKFELANLGNLIAIHIGTKFKCSESKWDRYLGGDDGALSRREKAGALLFYGKGRCVACHSGALMSDFDFHGIGTPQGRFGPHTRHRDIGRANVTTDAADLYKFRTPPLIQVSSTPPYGHNGTFPTLRDAVVHHFNPLAFYLANGEAASADYFEIGALLEARDSILSTIELGTEEDIGAILEFLSVL